MVAIRSIAEFEEERAGYLPVDGLFGGHAVRGWWVAFSVTVDYVWYISALEATAMPPNADEIGFSREEDVQMFSRRNQL